MVNRGIKVTPFGEVEVVYSKSGVVIKELPIQEVKFEELPKRFSVKHHGAILAIEFLVGEIVRRNREVPALREEVESMGVSKKILQTLEKMGFIKNMNISIKKVSGGEVGNRAVVVPTPLFHAYLESDAAKKFGTGGKDAD